MRAGAGGEETKGRVMAARKARQRWTCSRPTVGPGQGSRRQAVRSPGRRMAGAEGRRGKCAGRSCRTPGRPRALARSRAANLKIETVLLVTDN